MSCQRESCGGGQIPLERGGLEGTGSPEGRVLRSLEGFFIERLLLHQDRGTVAGSESKGNAGVTVSQPRGGSYHRECVERFVVGRLEPVARDLQYCRVGANHPQTGDMPWRPSSTLPSG